MRWTIHCAICGQALQVGEDHQGKLLLCPGCQNRVHVAHPVIAPPPRPVTPVSPPIKTSQARFLVRIGMVCLALALVAGVSLRILRPKNGGVPDVMPRAPMRVDMSQGLITSAPAPDPQIPTVESIQDAALQFDHRLPVQEGTSSQGVEVSGKLPCSLGFVQDPVTGCMLASTRDGRLHVIHPTNKRKPSWIQLQLPAYHLLIDEKQRLLYAVSSEAAQLRLGDLGERFNATGDLGEYDLTALLAAPQGKTLQPRRQLKIGSHITHMVTAPTGGALYYTSEGMSTIDIGRIDLREWKMGPRHSLRVPGPSTISWCASQKQLYALAGSRIYSIEPDSWTITDQVNVTGAAIGVLAHPDGRLYVLERSRSIHIKQVDLAKRKIVARWTIESDGRPYMSLSQDGNGLIIAVSSLTMGQMWGIDIAEQNSSRLRLLFRAVSTPDQLIRGGLHVAGDGCHVFLGSGQLYKMSRQG
ncbi:MAG: hypothetical protein U0840_19740 [Gemmataceae bacterium]